MNAGGFRHVPNWEDSLGQGLANFFYKRPQVNIFSFVGQAVSVATL